MERSTTFPIRCNKTNAKAGGDVRDRWREVQCDWGGRIIRNRTDKNGVMLYRYWCSSRSGLTLQTCSPRWLSHASIAHT